MKSITHSHSEVAAELGQSAKLTLQDIYKRIDAALDGIEPQADALLQTQKSTELLFELYALLAHETDLGNENSPDKALRACQAGCHACCTQLIPATPLEALVIAQYLRMRFRKAELKAIEDTLKHQAQQLKRSPLKSNRVSCSFLDPQGNCMVHEVRPARCRGYFSFSKAHCDANYQDPRVEIPVDGFAASWVRGTQSGFSSALARAGLDGDYYELQSAVSLALSQPALSQAWHEGTSHFKDCMKAQAQPKIIWVAPQAEGETVVLSRSTQNVTGKRIAIDII